MHSCIQEISGSNLSGYTDYHEVLVILLGPSRQWAST